jgi:hypothetical protein
MRRGPGRAKNLDERENVREALQEPIGARHVEETVGRPPIPLVLGRFDAGARIPNAPLGCRDSCRVASGAARPFLDLCYGRESDLFSTAAGPFSVLRFSTRSFGAGLHDSHHRRGFSHEPSVALHQFAKLSRAFLAFWAALLARRFCPDRAAVIVQCILQPSID